MWELIKASLRCINNGDEFTKKFGHFVYMGTQDRPGLVNVRLIDTDSGTSTYFKLDSDDTVNSICSRYCYYEKQMEEESNNLLNIYR